MVVLESPMNMFLTAVTSLLFFLVSSVSADSKCGVPEAVNNLKAEKTTNTTTHLSWQPPASTECLDHYKITYCSYLYDEERECAVKTVVLPLNTTQYDITGLKPCSNNTIQVHTVATDGTGTYTEMLLYTGSGDPPKVKKVNLSYVGVVNVTIDWNSPSNYSDQCYPGYKVCYSAKGDNKETCSYTVKNEFSTLSIASLYPCTEYNFSVATVDGNFAADSKISAKTYISVVTAPQMPNVTVEVHNHTAHATWKTPDALSMTCAASYEVRNCRNTGTVFRENCTTLTSQTLPPNSTEATITGLDSCTNNHISITLVGRGGQSSSKEVVILDQETEIPIPSNTSVSDVSTGEFTVDYDKGLNDCISSYRVCWFSDSRAETCRYTTREYTTAFTNLELTPCSSYTLHFTAIGSNGRSSNNFTTKFLTGPENALEQNMEISAHSVMLSWKVAPSALQCGTHYTITWGKFFSIDPVQRVVLPLNATSYNITDLNSGIQYVVTFVTDGTNGTKSAENGTVFFTALGDTSPLTVFDKPRQLRART